LSLISPAKLVSKITNDAYINYLKVILTTIFDWLMMYYFLILSVVKNSSTNLNTLITIFLCFNIRCKDVWRTTHGAWRMRNMTATGKMQKIQMQDQMDKALVITCQRMITRKIFEDSIFAIHSNRHPMKFN